MAYRITYEWQKEKELEKKPGLSIGAIIGMLAVAAALAVRLLVPQSETVFRELLHPLTDEHTISALAELMEQVGEGAPVPEAVTAFCQEIIGNGG